LFSGHQKTPLCKLRNFDIPSPSFIFFWNTVLKIQVGGPVKCKPRNRKHVAW
jgi:hypothetical protein